MKVTERRVKSALTKSNLPDADFVLNPYVGCGHGCIYCYADFMKRFTGHTGEDWGGFVDVKINAPELIEEDLRKVPIDSTIVIGSVTDPYQPAEGKYEITRKCLEEIFRVQPEQRLEILTKSPLILRDIDLLRKFRNLRVSISLGVLDEGYARQLEPMASAPHLRIDALKQLDQAGIKTVLFVSPIFPEFSNVYGIIYVAKGFADEMWFENLNIRANNRKRIMDFVRKNNPKLLPLYDTLDKNTLYWNETERKIREKCKKEEIKYKVYFHHGKDS